MINGETKHYLQTILHEAVQTRQRLDEILRELQNYQTRLRMLERQTNNEKGQENDGQTSNANGIDR